MGINRPDQVSGVHITIGAIVIFLNQSLLPEYLDNNLEHWLKLYYCFEHLAQLRQTHSAQHLNRVNHTDDQNLLLI